MARYLVDVVVTLEVECDSPDGHYDAVAELLDDLSPLYLVDWRLEDSFTVAEEPQPNAAPEGSSDAR